MTSELDGVATQFEVLRTRLEAMGDEGVLAEMLSALQATVAQQTEVVETILDRLPVGVMVLDRSYRLTRINRRAHEILGNVASSPMDEWPVELFHVDGTPMAFEERPTVRALHGEPVFNVAFEVRKGEPGAYVVRSSSTPIRDTAGDVVLAVTVFDDVTDEQRREQADRDFVANAAHQLRSPIAAMSSVLGALNAGAKNDPRDRDRFLAHIEREIRRMQQLADGLLALARSERGDSPAPLALIELRPLMQRVIDRSTRKDGVGVELECPEHLFAFTNEALLSEALANVVTNAIQHTTNGVVALKGEQQPDGARIDVCDGGPGIAGPERERIFERFYRGPRPVEAGIGLGLAIAAAATHAAGGELELVESPAGTCFRFTFGQTMLGA
jgi:PAS domain S-box-containing protein